MILTDYYLQEIQDEHSSMVSKIAGTIAKNVHGSYMEQDLIESAAALHDIGKNYVPYHILEKPNVLTPHEFNIIKTHTLRGHCHILAKIRRLLAASIVALQHHEYVNGTGYAGVLNIHPYAKLVAVADVFDALYSKRVYKKEWTAKAVCDYMHESIHKQFDGAYVTALMNGIDEILAAYEQVKEVM